MRRFFGLLFCLTLVWGAAAQERLSLDYFLPDSCNYDKQIPTPSSVLGFEVGEFQVTPEQGVAYIKALAAASDRVLLSGNLLPRLQEMLSGTPVAVLTALGRGRAVSLTVDPNFRAIWYGTGKLTANAMFWPELVSPASMR